MTLDEIREKYGNIELNEGFEYFIVKPKIGKVYSVDDLGDYQMIYFIDEEADVCSKTASVIQELYKTMVEQGNVFYDRNSAKEEVKRREVHHKVEKYAHKFSKQEWKDRNIKKYYPYYYYPAKTIEIKFVNFGRRAGLYFKTEEDIQKAIDEVGEKDFIRYYLGVEL